MIYFKTSKYNNEYIMINAKSMLELGQSQKLSDEELKEASEMFWDIYRFEKENNNIYIREVAIRKDSIMGQYLLNNSDKEIINEDVYVYEQDVNNALLIAIHDKNPIAEKIIPLFRNQIYGYKKELLKLFDEETLNYILEHDNFEQHINPEEEQECVVFENGKYTKKKLSTGKVLEKSN